MIWELAPGPVGPLSTPLHDDKIRQVALLCVNCVHMALTEINFEAINLNSEQ